MALSILRIPNGQQIALCIRTGGQDARVDGNGVQRFSWRTTTVGNFDFSGCSISFDQSGVMNAEGNIIYTYGTTKLELSGKLIGNELTVVSIRLGVALFRDNSFTFNVINAQSV